MWRRRKGSSWKDTSLRSKDGVSSSVLAFTGDCFISSLCCSDRLRIEEKNGGECGRSSQGSTKTEACDSVLHFAAFQQNPRGGRNLLPTLERFSECGRLTCAKLIGPLGRNPPNLLPHFLSLTALRLVLRGRETHARRRDDIWRRNLSPLSCCEEQHRRPVSSKERSKCQKDRTRRKRRRRYEKSSLGFYTHGGKRRGRVSPKK